ncbi:hypothetical protein MCUN1_003088 [Malassezia cuniculi]|uniref:ATPase inhibitor, mitochondrial n=1 Tax=Malassezia cuniculi TaxID=948313 RepID=A0AAF0JCS5_9BASI|nr:hypothetical protein MCUN1_003088 [Malassezia cuniculi]
MHAIRQSATTLARRTAVPRVNAVRMYTQGPSGSAGATARSGVWSKREKAQEDQYIIEEEKRKLKEREYYTLEKQAKLVENLSKQQEGKQ